MRAGSHPLTALRKPSGVCGEMLGGAAKAQEGSGRSAFAAPRSAGLVAARAARFVD